MSNSTRVTDYISVHIPHILVDTRQEAQTNMAEAAEKSTSCSVVVYRLI